MVDILLADDERALRESLKRILTEEGYSVRLARNGEEALAMFREARPDLLLLDVMMPKLNGFAVCEQLRHSGDDTPILFLTGVDGAVQEIKGLAAGADDYILKSAPREVFMARIRRALERCAALSAKSGAAPAQAAGIDIGEVHIDFAARAALSPDGGVVRLTGSELDILRVLSSGRGRYFTAAELVAGMHGDGYAADPVTLRSQISRLKAKLGECGGAICSERFLGYMLRAEGRKSG